MSAFNASKVYWRARCGLVWVERVEVWRELAEVEIDCVFSFVIFGSLSKNTKTTGLKKNTDCHLMMSQTFQKKRSILNSDCWIEDSDFLLMATWSLKAGFFLIEWNFPNLCRNPVPSIAIGWGYYMAACWTRCYAGETAWDKSILTFFWGSLSIILLEFIRVGLEAIRNHLSQKGQPPSTVGLLGYRKPMLIVTL